MLCELCYILSCLLINKYLVTKKKGQRKVVRAQVLNEAVDEFEPDLSETSCGGLGDDGGFQRGQVGLLQEDDVEVIFRFVIL